MIAFLEGLLLEKSPERITVMAGHVGYSVEIPMTTFYSLPDLGEPVQIHIHMLVREDAIRLFGFKDNRDKRLFEILMGVSRIGPKLALAIQSGLEYDQLRHAIVSENIPQLASIPGLGKKSAERLIFEAREKISILQTGSTFPDKEPEPGESHERTQEVIALLMNLGYKQKDAENAVVQVRNTQNDLDLKSMIKESLKNLSGRS